MTAKCELSNQPQIGNQLSSHFFALNRSLNPEMRRKVSDPLTPPQSGRIMHLSSQDFL